jgi:hypothetical protein
MLAIIIEILCLCVFLLALFSHVSKIKESTNKQILSWYSNTYNRETINTILFLVFLCGLCFGAILVSVGDLIIN